MTAGFHYSIPLPEWEQFSRSVLKIQSLSVGQSPVLAPGDPIVPAQGRIFNDKGEVVLTAYNPTVTRLSTQPTRLKIA